MEVATSTMPWQAKIPGQDARVWLEGRWLLLRKSACMAIRLLYRPSWKMRVSTFTPRLVIVLNEVLLVQEKPDDKKCTKLKIYRSGPEWTCKIMAKHQGSEFVRKTYSTFEEISAGGRSSDQGRFNGWKDSKKHDKIMRTTGSNIFGCYNEPNGEFSHCVFQKLGSRLSVCKEYV